MKEDKDELLSLQYRMEKSDVKQQKLEDRLVSVSKALQKSNRSKNILLLLFIFCLVSMLAGFYYLSNDLEKDFLADSSSFSDTTDEVRRINDSLKLELAKLRSSIEKYKNSTAFVADSIGRSTEDTLNISEKDSLKKKFERKYGYVVKAYQGSGAVFIELDDVEYFEGKKAVKMAQEYGAAEYDINEKGDTIYFLYNNHYIHNRNQKTVILELHERVKFKLNRLNQISNVFSLKAFNEIIKDKPLFALETNNGVVYKITEQKLK